VPKYHKHMHKINYQNAMRWILILQLSLYFKDFLLFLKINGLVHQLIH